MAKDYSETFINIIETICEHCNARTDDCYVDGDDAYDCVLCDCNGMQDLFKLCVQVDEITHSLKSAADTASRSDYTYDHYLAYLGV